MQVERDIVIDILRSSYLFSDLSDEQVEAIADQAHAFLFAQGQTIFEQDSVADSFYFIYSGQVLLTRVDRTEETRFVLSERDFFGQEAIADRPPERRASATARTDIILLRFTGEELDDFCSKYPQLSGAFRQVFDSYQIWIGLDMPWRGPREVIHYIDRQHPIFFLLKIAPSVLTTFLIVLLLTYLDVVSLKGAVWATVALVVSIVGGLTWIILEVIDFFNDYAVITNRRVAFLRKVLLIYDSRQEVPLDAILSDDIRTTQVGRILGYGNIVIRTFTGELTLERLENPRQVLNTINRLRDRAKDNKRQARLDEIDRTLQQRIFGKQSEMLGKAADEVEPVQPKVQAGALTQWLSDVFMLRTEENGVITYRTHWVILIKKAWLPSILLLALLAVTIAVLVHAIAFNGTIMLLLDLVLIPIFAGWWVYQYVDWRNDRYIITRDMLVDVYRKPLGVEQKRSSPIKNILSIDFERIGLPGLIFNFGTVYIRVGDSTLTFDNVPSPSDVQRELFQRLMDYKKQEEDRAEKSINDQLVDWIEHYHHILQQNQTQSEEDDSDTI